MKMAQERIDEASEYFGTERFRGETNDAINVVVSVAADELGEVMTARFVWEMLTRGLSEDRAYQEVSEVLERRLGHLHDRVMERVSERIVAGYGG